MKKKKTENVTEKFVASKLSLSELIHKWCNGLIPNDRVITRGRYKMTNTAFYVNDNIFAMLNNGYLIIRPFGGGGWGNGIGISDYDVSRAYPDKSKIVIVHEVIRYYSDPTTPEKWIDFNGEIKRVFRKCISADLDYLSKIKDYIFDDKHSTWYNRSDIHIKENVDTVLEPLFKYYDLLYRQKKVDIPRSKLFKNILNQECKIKLYYQHYSGWSASGTSTLSIETEKFKTFYNNYSFNYYINKFIGKDAVSEFAFKVWRHAELKVENTFARNVKESRVIYNDPERKANILEAVSAKKAEINRIAKAKYEKQKAEDAKSRRARLLEELRKFLSGEPYTSWILGNNTYHFLRLENETTIRTSYGVSIDIVDAKRLYDVVKRINKPMFFERDKIKIGGYSVVALNTKNIYDVVTDTTIEDLCLIVGCHTIPMFEIDRFVKESNLGWDEKTQIPT